MQTLTLSQNDIQAIAEAVAIRLDGDSKLYPTIRAIAKGIDKDPRTINKMIENGQIIITKSGMYKLAN